MCLIDYGNRMLKIGLGREIRLAGSDKSVEEILDTRLREKLDLTTIVDEENF